MEPEDSVLCYICRKPYFYVNLRSPRSGNLYLHRERFLSPTVCITGVVAQSRIRVAQRLCCCATLNPTSFRQMIKNTPTAVRSFRFPSKLADELEKMSAAGSLSTFIRASVAAFIKRPSRAAVPYLGKTSDAKFKLRVDGATKRLWQKVAKEYCAKANITQLLIAALYRQLKPQPETGRGL